MPLLNRLFWCKNRKREPLYFQLIALLFLSLRMCSSFRYSCYEDVCSTEKLQYCNHRKEIRMCDYCYPSVCEQDRDDIPQECQELLCSKLVTSTQLAMHESTWREKQSPTQMNTNTLILIVILVVCALNLLVSLPIGRTLNKLKCNGKTTDALMGEADV